MSDIDIFLWSKVKMSDIKAFELLFQKYYQALCFLSKRYTNDITTSKEIVQDLFIHIWEHRVDIIINTSFKSYLYTSIRYNSIRRIKNDKKVNILDTLPEQINYNEFHDHIEYAELQERIIKVIDSLPKQCRKIFIMSRFDRLKYSEIASELGLSIKTVEAQISKALRILQYHLKDIINTVIFSLIISAI